ncbi:SPbeta prophage-derived endonuclease YokF [Neobacillus rhizosphaerae]|uniref:SPbeta prophage-derived endonuclease YokF n=1 Tax=Neobacillus rhizosphaerae TaxID=2880965 RepID=A0ABN8KR83_9BACI|nr:thermonuclease family protein [Neobacillus rhizosphaerae]CAH2715022.1 SPbeta prophage-derived endonuclease YokF [Neobacillus rhizosphaerae]
MKLVLNLVVSGFLLLGLTACNQGSAEKTSSTAEQTSEKVESVKEQKTDTVGKSQVNQSENSKEQPQTKEDSNQVPVTLVEAVDGDTIKVTYNGEKETVRYLLVDTPEEKKPNTCVQPFAVEAYKRNNQLLNSGQITLEFDHGNKRDKYGRLLAYVFVNGASVQETLLKEGYARIAYVYQPPYKYLDQFQADENQAKNKKLNIWSQPGFATDRGFNGCVNSAAKPTNQPGSTSSSSKTTTQSSNTPNSSGTEFFANCTELRKKYPDGVSKGHPAYQAKMDRDNDGYACDR